MQGAGEERGADEQCLRLAGIEQRLAGIGTRGLAR